MNGTTRKDKYKEKTHKEHNNKGKPAPLYEFSSPSNQLRDIL